MFSSRHEVNVTKWYGPLNLPEFYWEYWWVSLQRLRGLNVSAHLGAQKGLLQCYTLDLFWIFSLLFWSLFITLCITKSFSPLSNPSLLTRHPLPPQMLVQHQRGAPLVAGWDRVPSLLFSAHATKRRQSVPCWARCGNEEAQKGSFFLGYKKKKRICSVEG